MNQLSLPSSAFAAPTDDPRFVALGDDLRTLVCRRLEAMRVVCSAPKVSVGLRLVAQQYGEMRGMKPGRVRDMFGQFAMTNGDWTVLLNKARAGAAWWRSLNQIGIPAEFAEYLGQHYAANQRDRFRPFYLYTLVPQYRRWARGDADAALPGYQRCPKAGPRGVPAGWSYGHLLRIAKRAASDYSRKTIQIGPKAASQMGAMILTTREGLAPGQVYIFDDSKNDFKVLFKGRSCDLWSLHCLDLASGCNVLRGYKPSINDDGARENIREREMLFLLSALGATIGFHPSGCWLICEKGTATVRPRDEELLHQIWPEFFHVARGPMGGGPGIAALCTGPEGGNPRWKAPLEAWHNIIRNASASLLDWPGQTGSLARVNDPEGMERLAATDEALHRAGQLLPPELFQRLQFGLMSHSDAILRLEALTEVLNTRRDHVLEGWRRCGHYRAAFRLAAHLPPMPAEIIPTLSPALQSQVQLTLAAHPELAGEQALHPREVFEAGRPKLRKFTPHQVAMLLGELPGDERPVRNAILEVNVPEVDPDEPLRYGPLYRDLRGGEIALRNGDTYCVRVNPLIPETAFLYDAKGGLAGLAAAAGRVNRLDQEALQQQFATKKKALAQWTAEARQMAAPITARAVSRAANNAAVFREAAGRSAQFDDETDAALQSAVEL